MERLSTSVSSCSAGKAIRIGAASAGGENSRSVRDTRRLHKARGRRSTLLFGFLAPSSRSDFVRALNIEPNCSARRRLRQPIVPRGTGLRGGRGLVSIGWISWSTLPA